jgi:hypothetical protein
LQQVVAGKFSLSSQQMKASVTKIGVMIDNDVTLLRDIKQQVDAIEESTTTKSFLHNVVISQWTGRIEKIRKLEAELMARFQIVTAVMMKELYKVCIYSHRFSFFISSSFFCFIFIEIKWF